MNTSEELSYTENSQVSVVYTEYVKIIDQKMLYSVNWFESFSFIWQEKVCGCPKISHKATYVDESSVCHSLIIFGVRMPGIPFHGLAYLIPFYRSPGYVCHAKLKGQILHWHFDEICAQKSRSLNTWQQVFLGLEWFWELICLKQ